MVLLEKLWNDLVDRAETNSRLAGRTKITTTPPLIITDVGRCKCKRTRSVPGCSAAAVTPTAPVCKDSVFYHHHPAAGVVESGGFFYKTQLYSEEGAKGKLPLLT